MTFRPRWIDGAALSIVAIGVFFLILYQRRPADVPPAFRAEKCTAMLFDLRALSADQLPAEHTIDPEVLIRALERFSAEDIPCRDDRILVVTLRGKEVLIVRPPPAWLRNPVDRSEPTETKGSGATLRAAMGAP